MCTQFDDRFCNIFQFYKLIIKLFAIKMLYFDYNATTPLSSQVIDIINETMVNNWFNPSNIYSESLSTKQIIKHSRHSLSVMINALSDDNIVFTSGGTESNNWVIYS